MMDHRIRQRLNVMRWVLVAMVLASAGKPPLLKAAQPEQGAVILMYHRFGEDAYPSTSIRLEQFDAHLAELKRGSYHVLPVPEIVRALAEGRPLPDRTIGITIDDGFLSVYTQAWPRLKKAGFPFTLFVATDPLDKRYGGMMTWEQTRELVASGLVSIGNHTASHPHMADQSAARNRREVEQATTRIQAELGLTPSLFSYPYGEYSRAVTEVVRQAGFAVAFGQQSGVIARGADLMTLPRFALNEHYGSPDRFKLVVNALPLPVSDVVPDDMVIPRADNPPRIAFRVGDTVGSLAGLKCYASDGIGVRLAYLEGRQVEVRLDRPFPSGRSRINCTLEGPQGRWRWYGMQFYVPGS